MFPNYLNTVPPLKHTYISYLPNIISMNFPEIPMKYHPFSDQKKTPRHVPFHPAKPASALRNATTKRCLRDPS